jgi:GT2 family glycosyltransferase
MRPLAIVVPVYNGPEHLDRCLASLARHRPPDSAIILVDDASTDARVVPRLREFERSQPAVEVLTSSQNRGFIASANRGAAAALAGSDILFLNMDTEVTGGWAAEMQAALEAEPNAAICCPLSNNATILSVPQFQQENSLPYDWDAERTAAFVRACAGDERAIPIPTPVGFCMLVRRDDWDRFGPFDEAFGRGYGEEDDFGQRVQAAGRSVVCAPRAFVYHESAASFGTSPQVAEQRRANNRLLLSRWPDYDAKTRAWCQSNPLRPLHERIWHALIAPAGVRPVHVLHLVREWQLSGPVRENLVAIVEATHDFASHTIVVPTPDQGAWMDAIDFESEQGMRVVGLIDLERRFARFLDASPADLVHVHGGDWLSEALVESTRRQRPVLVTPAGALDPARCAAMYRRVNA